MERLKRCESGQYDDKRYEEIKNDIDKAMDDIFDKWKDILPSDIEFIMLREIPWISTQRLILNNSQGNLLK